MCAWVMKSEDEHGEGLVKKETCWVTNSEHIAREVDRECQNVRKQQVGERPPAAWHRHVHLSITSGRTRPESTPHYSLREFCAALARNCRRLGR